MWGSSNAPSKWVCVCSRAWRKEEKGFEEERKGGAGAWEGGQQTTGRNPGDGPG